MKILTISALLFTSFLANAQTNHSIDSIYLLFMNETVDVQSISDRYIEDVIHVGDHEGSLLRGKTHFLNKNIVPFKNMLENGDFELLLRTYVVRRIESDGIANDVGYLYSKITMPDGSEMEQVQKYSWVFIKENNSWKVATDFDKTKATLKDLKDAIKNGARLIENKAL